jgi:hypothetical protein
MAGGLSWLASWQVAQLVLQKGISGGNALQDIVSERKLEKTDKW